ncbi:MAG: hypothetical protein QXE31_03685 [Candidatus Woesearchaeota archaeon]
MKIFKKRGKSQFAMEYVLMIAIALAILLSGIYVFRNYVFQSNDFAINNKLNQISNLIINNARKIYYYGVSSRTTLTFEMPSGITNMYILNVKGGNETYLIFKYITTGGENKVMYESSVPLYGDNCDINPDELCIDNDCKCLKKSIYGEGLKGIYLDVIPNCIYKYQNNNVIQKICVNISKQEYS